MRVIMEVRFPVEPFNTLVREAKIEDTMRKLMETTHPEAAYFTEFDGKRGGFLVVDMPHSSDIPRFAEPWFLALSAEVRFRPAMTPEDLAKANLNAFAVM